MPQTEKNLVVCQDFSTGLLLMAIKTAAERGYHNVIVRDKDKNFICAKRTTKINFQRDYQPDNEYIRLQLAQQNFGSSKPMTTVFEKSRRV